MYPPKQWARKAYYGDEFTEYEREHPLTHLSDTRFPILYHIPEASLHPVTSRDAHFENTCIGPSAFKPFTYAEWMAKKAHDGDDYPTPVVWNKQDHRERMDHLYDKEEPLFYEAGSFDPTLRTVYPEDHPSYPKDDRVSEEDEKNPI